MPGDPPGPRRLLVVDDQPDMLFILTRQLARAGVETTVCSTPEEALKALAGGGFFGALVDLYFGNDPAGWDLIAAIRGDARHRRLPIVSMTGSTAKDLARCREAGADAALPKPFLVSDLLEALDAAAAARGGDGPLPEAAPG